ncbi:MAG: hypothetical protein EXR86_01965 [Gammaproteobacteria bacterium]|nr:hypothetical protein [Gammaproteobacteria bacterium]
MYNKACLPNSEQASSLTNLVQIYSDRLEDRKQRLRDDQAFYRAKLEELEVFDPQDCTGLRRIYANPLERTSDLLRTVSL